MSFITSQNMNNDYNISINKKEMRNVKNEKESLYQNYSVLEKNWTSYVME